MMTITVNPSPIIRHFGRATQEQIAEAVGVSRLTVAAWLAGDMRRVDLDTLERFCLACNAQPQEFLVWTKVTLTGTADSI